MNSLEASRVLAVLDDALDGVNLLSYVTTEVLDTADQLRDLLGEDLVNNLIKHRAMLQSGSKLSLSSDPAMTSTWELVRLLKKSPSTPKLQKLHTERSPAMLQVIAYVTKLRHYAQKRLTTTVEEDSSNREYYEEVKEREERAVSEKIQLEQKLKLQRVELHKQANQMQSAEDKTRAELHDLSTKTGAHKSAIETGAANVRIADSKSFASECEELQKELDQAKAQLAGLRDEYKATEAALRKQKKRTQQDVESVIGEYDADLGSKEKEYQEAHAEYQEVLQKLDAFTLAYNEMHAERMEFEERMRKLAEQRLQEGLKNVRRNRAARVIQAAWKAWKAKKAAELKKKKKAEAAAKKKK